MSNAKNLEKKVETETEVLDQLDENIKILSSDEYYKIFSERYKKEEAFKDIMHNYLGVNGFERFGLGLLKKFNKKSYEKKTQTLIKTYSEKIKTDLEHAKAAKEETQKLKEERKRAEETKELLGSKLTAYQTIEKQLQERIAERNATEQKILQDYDAMTAEEKLKKLQQKKEIDVALNAERIAREKLEEFVKNSSFTRIDEHGQLSFNEKEILRLLEDRFLNEIIEGIEKETDRGFMSQIKEIYDGVISQYDELEDLEEIPHIDWVQSAIYSRTKGYMTPQFPYIITGKPEKGGRGKASIDTAIALDTSGSMRDNNRFYIAKKTTLALHALMRKLNPENKTYLSQFTDNLSEITTAELMKMGNAEGRTATEKALDWLINKLEGNGPALAYLITDGDPNDLSATIKAARNYSAHPQIQLRIFLVDGDSCTEDKIRKIGKAAGNSTKVIPVKNYQLANGLIKDVSKAIGNMYSISYF